MATIGDTGSPSTNTVYYDSLLSTTLAAYRKTLYDNIFKDSAFLAYLRMSDAIIKQNGGERVALPLLYGDNNTVKTHSGYEIIDTTPQEGMTTAFYEWAEIAGSISISRKEERQNAGEGRILNLLEAKIKQAEMTMREYLNQSLVQGTVSSATFVENTSASGSCGLIPLGMFFRKVASTDPTTNNIGNIAAASHSWWRSVTAGIGANGDAGNATFTLNVTTYAGMIVALRRFYNYLSRGSGGSPDLFLMVPVRYVTYENALDTTKRYQNTKMAYMGFDTI